MPETACSVCFAAVVGGLKVGESVVSNVVQDLVSLPAAAASTGMSLLTTGSADADVKFSQR